MKKRFFIIALFVSWASGCMPIDFVKDTLPDVDDYLEFALDTIQPAATPFQFYPASEASSDFYGKNIRLMRDISLSNLTMDDISLDDYLEGSPTTAFMIIRHDTVLYERYFDKAQANEWYSSFSVAKTFIGMLMGIAQEEGYIRSMSQKVVDFLPEIDAERFSEVTLQDLLNQTSGIRFPPSATLYYSRDLTDILHKMSVRTPAGSDFRYENGNTQLLGWILERATNRTLGDYFEEKIWKKIGTEYPLLWSYDSPVNHNVKAFCCMQARTHDFAKFGRLLLHRGKYGNEQVIPEGWINETFDRSTCSRGRFPNYKNQLWSENNGCFTAMGLYGQYIYVYPPKDLIIVRFATINPMLTAWNEIFDLITQQL